MKKIYFVLFLFVMLLIPILNVETEEKTIYDGSNVQKTDNNYDNAEQVKVGDRQQGWTLGDFIVSDYSSRLSDSSGNDIFLKKIGDKITLSFDLQQNIKKLNNNDNFQIASIKNANLVNPTLKGKINGLGTLVVQMKEPSGKLEKAKVYKNYLSGVNKNANAEVITLEEGDYHAVLCYAIDDTSFLGDILNRHQYYRIDYNFKIRNGNANAFIKDISTKSELEDGATTTNGFTIDTANSKYLNIQIVKTNQDGKVVKNVPYKSGESIDDEGKYEISITTDYSNIATKKTIYVKKKSVTKTVKKEVTVGPRKNKSSIKKHILLVVLLIIAVSCITIRYESKRNEKE